MSNAGINIVSHAQSDVGRKRAHNEDRFLVLQAEKFFAVADGMGGHAGGETASRLAVSTIGSVIRNNSHVLSEDNVYEGDLEANPVAKLLSDALRSACHDIYEEGKVNPSLQGMGTTVTSILFFKQDAFIAHVGDSRAYLLRENQLLQLSEDHSLINEQLKAGLITAEQAKQSRFRNIITRSVGFEDDVDVDMISLRVQPKDTFLLSTDGLTGLVADQEILNILTSNALDESPQLLIDLANKRGGDDNTTVVIVHVLATEVND